MVAFVRPLSAVGSRSQIAKSVPTPARCSAVKEDQHGKKVVVIGLAASGRAAAKLVRWPYTRCPTLLNRAIRPVPCESVSSPRSSRTRWSSANHLTHGTPQALARGANVVGMDINHGTIPLEVPRRGLHSLLPHPAPARFVPYPLTPLPHLGPSPRRTAPDTAPRGSGRSWASTARGLSCPRTSS